MLKPCAECGQEISTQARACPIAETSPSTPATPALSTICRWPKTLPTPATPPHGVCPAFVDYMSGSLIELLNAKQPKMHGQLT